MASQQGAALSPQSYDFESGGYNNFIFFLKFQFIVYVIFNSF